MYRKNHTVISRFISPGLLRAMLLFLFLQPCTIVFASSGTSSNFTIKEVAPGNYVHYGVHVPFEDPHHDDIANIGFIVGTKCVAIIDTGGSVTIGKALRESIRTVTDLPVCYVINTHVHFDHVLGNLAFKQDTPEFIGHAALADAIENNRAFFLQEFARDLGPEPDENAIIAPTRTVEELLELDIGDRKLLLTSYPTAHSHTDLTVLDEKTRTLWTGDLVFREHIPVLDGDLKSWISVMDKLKQVDVTTIIPGHGPSGKSWQEVMTAQENYLNSLLNETREGIANGLFMEEAINTIGEKEKGNWLLYDQHHRSNVSKSFTQLEWE